MDKSYVWQGDYGRRSHLIPVFSKILDEQDATSLTMMAFFVNNNPYNLEFFIALNYEEPEKEDIQTMIDMFEGAGLKYRNDITSYSLLLQIGARRFNSSTIIDSGDLDILFSNLFCFAEVDELKSKGYSMQPFGKDKQVFISYSSKDRDDVKKLIPYLNGIDLPVWFDESSILVGQSITDSVQNGIDQSDMVILWVTRNFIDSKWCNTEMIAFTKKMIEEGSSIFLVLDDDMNAKELPLFLRDMKYLRREGRDIHALAEELATVVKNSLLVDRQMKNKMYFEA